MSTPSYVIKVEGVNEIAKAMDRFPQALTTRLRAVIGGGALNIVARAKVNSPVKTGRLRSSLSWDWVAGNPLSAVAGTSVEYAPYQEFRKTKEELAGMTFAPISTQTWKGRGPFFLARAVNVFKPKIEERIAEAIKNTPL